MKTNPNYMIFKFKTEAEVAELEKKFIAWLDGKQPAYLGYDDYFDIVNDWAVFNISDAGMDLEGENDVASDEEIEVAHYLAEYLTDQYSKTENEFKSPLDF